MNFEETLKNRGLFRFTGPPEHWLTAVKFMTWGLEEKHRTKWEKLQPGDVFFIHSTGPQTSFFNNAKSGVIGLGVVGPDFSVKKNLLWLYETKNSVNRWPLLIPLSEIYLFSELPVVGSWDNPNPKNTVETKILIDALLKNYIPLSKIKGFPQMGSFSSVSKDVVEQIFFDKRPLYLHSGYEEAEKEKITLESEGKKAERPLYEVKTAAEALRYADTLQVFDSVKARVIREPTSQYLRNNEILELANSVHASILQQLIDLFRKRGYETRSGPRSLDLFAHNGRRAFLCEVKSTENQNFRVQARKGIAQLFEYEYFDVRKFAKDKDLTFTEKYKLIVPSQKPKDTRYVEFINSLTIGVATTGIEKLNPVGQDFGFSKI